jgi:hypothetical protein
MEQNLSSEADSRLAGQEISLPLQNPKVNYRIYQWNKIKEMKKQLIPYTRRYWSNECGIPHLELAT